MEIIAKISKGSKMDQIYIPKNRESLVTGSYVIIRPLGDMLQTKKEKSEKPYFYNVNFIEPLKLEIIKIIFSELGRIVEDYENILITGSFLDKGFNFNDIDVIMITGRKVSEKQISKIIENKIGIKTHLIVINNKSLIKGLASDPLYQMFLSKCISKKRFIYKINRKETKIDYKLLDLHLLKSKLLIDNFDFLNGDEKYDLARNMIGILLFLEDKKISKDSVDKEIMRLFKVDIRGIKQNLLNKIDFIKRYKSIYERIFKMIMKGVKNSKNKSKNASKQK